MGKDDKLNDALAGTGDKPDAATRSPTDKPIKSVYFGWDMFGTIDKLAAKWGLNDSEVVRWLVRQGLETGKEPPKVTVTRRKVD